MTFPMTAARYVGAIGRGLIRAFSLEDPSQPLLPMDAMFESLGLGRSDAGVMVNEKQAMRLVAAYGCLKVKSQDLSRLPLEIFQNMPDGSLRLATEHKYYGLVHDRPNAKMSSQVWRMAMHASCGAYGNAYSWIKRDRAGRPIEFIPLASDKTAPVHARTKDGGHHFCYGTTQTDNGQVLFIEPDDILHFMDFTLDGIIGLSPIQTCKNAFGLGLAAEKFGAQFFGNGARSTGVFTHPDQLDPEAHENLVKSIYEKMTGDRALRPIVLEEGMKWQQITIPPNDAQFLETRKFQKEEVACLYRVPMHLLQDLQRATNNNIEHQGLDYVRFCLAPSAVNMEQEINYKLLGGGFICEHNFMDLQRGDFESQSKGLALLRSNGIYSVNRCLRQLREAPISKAEGGDLLIVNGTYISLASLANGGGQESDNNGDGQGNSPDSDPGDPAARGRKLRIAAAFTPLFRDAVGRWDNRKRDPQFARQAFVAAVKAMRGALLAWRFGNGTITDADEAKINDAVDSIVADIDNVSGLSKDAIADRWVSAVYDALAKGIC